MQRTTLLKGFLVLAILAIAGTTLAGIQGSGLMRVATFGRITAVGGVTVNGVEYATANARVSVDGVAADQSDLRVGQVVTIRGTVDRTTGMGTADEIAFVGDVRGVVTAVDRYARAFTVLGQTVRVTDETIIDDAPAGGAAALSVGTSVEASGFGNSSGELLASRVDTRVADATAQVRGPAADLDAHGRTFRINQLLIDYDDAEVEGRLAEGATVVVQGEVDRAAGTLHAERVDVPLQLGASGEKGDVEGIITSFGSDADFELNGLRVLADEHTHYVLHGAALGRDAAVHVSGRFSFDALVADKIEVRSNEPGARLAKQAKNPKELK
jgi:uncharacterized protein DUF5666